MGGVPFKVMDLAILVDFDGTIASSDASYAVLKKFAKDDWLAVEEKAYAHEITILDALKVQATMIKVGPEEASRFLRETMGIRPGFREFAEWCRENEIYLEICSDGFGWTIEILLCYWNLDWIPWTSNHTVPDRNGWKISFPYRKEDCPINANCKCSHFERLKENHGKVLFIGDGTTDECVSKRADLVFARDKLLEICIKEGTDCIPWDRWDEIFNKVKDLV